MARSSNPFIGMRDKYNYEVDPAATLDERYAELGCVWRLATARAAISDTGKQDISFTTPAASVAKCFINHIDVRMYGNVLDLKITEGPTLAAGSAATPRNMSRTWSATPDSGCPLLNPKTACTYADGTVIFDDFVGGGANPAQFHSDDSSSEGWLEPKPSTAYAISITAVGAVTWAKLGVRIACLVEQK